MYLLALLFILSPFIIRFCNMICQILKTIIMLLLTIFGILLLIRYLPTIISGFIKSVGQLCSVIWSVMKKFYYFMNKVSKITFRFYRRVPHFVAPFDLFMSWDEFYQKYTPAQRPTKIRVGYCDMPVIAISEDHLLAAN